jgi:cell division protease FtsH
MMTREELRDRICVLFGGRTAEELACRDVSTGAEDDFERATELARLMVCRFGMSELGAQSFGRAPGRYAQLPMELESRVHSERTAERIDEAVARVLDEEHRRARRILTERRGALDDVATMLLAKETLERSELEAIAHEERPREPALH